VAEAGGPRARGVAAFDFDGTLTRRDSLLPFLGRVCGTWSAGRAFARVAPALALDLAGRGDRDTAKERMLVRLLAGRTRDELARVGAEYGEYLVEHQLRPDMRARLAWHRDQGHETVIVSASLDVYLRTVQRRLGVDVLLCSVLEFDDGGRCTGRLLGGNCRGAAKATRLRAHLGSAPVELWAYGDSAGDTAMLAMADHPNRVH
jgi:HAD superfamily hydrolase (TIGR01490 family)